MRIISAASVGGFFYDSSLDGIAYDSEQEFVQEDIAPRKTKISHRGRKLLKLKPEIAAPPAEQVDLGKALEEITL